MTIDHSKQKIIRRIIQVVIVIAIFCMAIGNIAPENDIYWQLKVGESIWKYHVFPIFDPYNFSNPHAVWTLEEWIVEVIFYILQSHFGWGSLIILKAVVIAGTFALLLHILNRIKINLYLSLIALFFATMVNTRGYWTVFPSIFEYLFVIVAFYLMEVYRDNNVKIIPYLIPLFSLIWANSHASFFLLEIITLSYAFGSILVIYKKKKNPQYDPIGGYLSVSQIKALLFATGVAICMPFISPNTYNTWLYPFIISTAKFATGYVNEYVSFPEYIGSFGSSFLVTFAMVLFSSTIFMMLFGKKRLNPIDVFVFSLFSYLAFRALRHLAIFALIALPIFTRYASIWFREYRGWMARNIVKDVSVILILFAFIFWYKTRVVPFGLSIDMSGFPVGAADFVLENHIQPYMFNHYNYGGFLIWKMTGYQVFIDGRLEMYLGKAGEDYITMLGAQPGWQQLLDKYHINFTLNYASTALTKEMLSSPDWRLVYFDRQYVVFVRNNKANQGVIAKFYNTNQVKTYTAIYMNQARDKTSEDYYNQGIDALHHQDYQKAIKAFKVAISLSNGNTWYLFYLAQSYTGAHLYKDAAQTYQTILLVDPKNALARKQLVLLERFISFQ